MKKGKYRVSRKMSTYKPHRGAWNRFSPHRSLQQPTQFTLCFCLTASRNTIQHVLLSLSHSTKHYLAIALSKLMCPINKNSLLVVWQPILLIIQWVKLNMSVLSLLWCHNNRKIKHFFFTDFEAESQKQGCQLHWIMIPTIWMLVTLISSLQAAISKPLC